MSQRKNGIRRKMKPMNHPKKKKMAIITTKTAGSLASVKALARGTIIDRRLGMDKKKARDLRAA